MTVLYTTSATMNAKTDELEDASQRITNLAEFAAEFPGNGDHHFISISREGEKPLVDVETGCLAYKGSAVRAEMNGVYQVAPEFSEGVIEPGLRCFHRNNEDFFLREYWEANIGIRKYIQDAAKKHGCLINETGSSYYPLSHLLEVDKWMTKVPMRYGAIRDSLGRRYGGEHKVKFEYFFGGSEEVPVSGNPALAISTAQDSPNPGFSPEYIGRYFDFFQGPAQLISALFSNSAVLGSHLGVRYNNRIFQWRHAMSRNEELTPFSLGSYTDVKGAEVLGNYLKFVHDHAQEILSIDQAGKMAEEFRPWKNLRLLSGTLWMISTRLQWRHNDDGKIVLWLEVRSLDAQPTLGMALAVELAMIGYALYWVKEKGIDSVSEVMPHDVARKCFEHILMYGPYSKLPLSGASLTGAEWFERVSEQAIQGLLADEVCSMEFAASAMNLLTSSLRNGTTGTLWFRKEVAKRMKKGASEDQAIREAMIYLASFQAEQCTKFGDFQNQGLPVI